MHYSFIEKKEFSGNQEFSVFKFTNFYAKQLLLVKNVSKMFGMLLSALKSNEVSVFDISSSTTN